MKKWIAIAALMAVSGLFTAQTAFAEEDATVAKEEQASEPVKDRPEWNDTLKKQYNLTDEQIKAMKDSGISNPQMAMVAKLAEKSGKSIDEVLKMRTEGKMGWGKIAKELGVHPGELGKAVASARHEINGGGKDTEKQADKAAERAERKAAKKAEKEDKQQARMDRKAEKAAEKSHGKGH